MVIVLFESNMMVPFITVSFLRALKYENGLENYRKTIVT